MERAWRRTKGHLVVMQVGVEHDDRVGQNVHGVCIVEELRALLMVQAAKGLHDAVDLLGFPWQPKGFQIQPYSSIKAKACKQPDCISRNIAKGAQGGIEACRHSNPNRRSRMGFMSIAGRKAEQESVLYVASPFKRWRQ